MSEKRDIRIYYGTEVDDSVKEQGEVFLHALLKWQERNAEYKDNWRRYGWRGGLYDLRRKVERAWDMLWDKAPPLPDDDEDDLIDIANYAAMTIRAINEANRDGTGGWW